MSSTKEKTDGEGGGQKAGEVRRQGCRNGVAGADDAGGAEVDGNGVEGGFRAAHHHGGHPADLAVRAMGGHKVAGHGQSAAAGHRADQHKGNGLRRDAQPLQNRGAERC